MLTPLALKDARGLRQYRSGKPRFQDDTTMKLGLQPGQRCRPDWAWLADKGSRIDSGVATEDGGETEIGGEFLWMPNRPGNQVDYADTIDIVHGHHDGRLAEVV